MNKQKQIEEMAKDMLGEDYAIVIIQAKSTTLSDNTKKYCQRLIEEGYRKIPENAVVLTREELDAKEMNFAKERKYAMEKTRKKTAEKFAEMSEIKSVYFNLDGTLYKAVLIEDINEICKEFTEVV